MTIIFNYLFTPIEGFFKTRVPIRIRSGKVLPKGIALTAMDLDGIDLLLWSGKNLIVTVSEGVYTIHGLVDS
ncbi:hypothetical protein WBJ53_23470 [Spirosoma sp. SC4-14]|uniref:hypothetical protein n=1 Tax=Spirosoma sp. SC4-14 TaxID=3128900 RepID=UPI0030D4A940